MAKSVIDNKLNLLSTRAGFNQALRHFKTALGFSEDISQGYNLADILNEALENQELENHQIIPIINILLADKFGYKSKSENLDSILNDLKNLSTTVKTWNLINFIMDCYSSDGTPQVVNPANIEALDSLLPLNSGELVVCYAGSNYIEDDSIIKAALEDFIKLLYGGKIKGKKAYMDDNTNVEASKPEAPVSSKLVSSNISKKYGVVVTNELFHNGNVEAWKRIIESYVTAHSGCDVLVWYEGERINDINALFKWGKVKRGCPIMFSVVGESLKNISKLKKYLFEGASSRYEVFLRGQVGAVLDLF